MAAREVTAEIRSRGFTLAYTVVNISTGGLLITGARPPPRGGLLEIEIRQTGTRSVLVSGKVVHELPEGIGIAFEPFSTAIAESLEKLIAAVDARNNLPPPLPPPLPSRPHKEDPAAPNGPDPFAAGPDPRPPRSGSPDERIDYLRTLVKKRDEALQRGRTMFAALSTEVDELRASSARNKSRLDAAVSQLALGEAALAASRKSTEKQQAELDKERAAAKGHLDEERDAAREMLELEQRRTLEAIAAVAGLEAKMRRFESEAAKGKEEAETARREAKEAVEATRREAKEVVDATRRDAKEAVEIARREAKEVVADAAGLRKTREELVIANRKAMESQVALTKERASRIAADAMINEARAAQQFAESETKKLAGELARLKAKLIAAENALEQKATRKAPDQRAK